MIGLAEIVLIILFIMALIDIFIRKIPAIFLTATMLLVLMVNMVNIEFGLIHLAFGVVGLLFAIILYEGRFIGGMADIKILTAIGMMVATIPYLFHFMILTVVFGILYKGIWVYVLKMDQTKEVAFVPVLLAVYIVMYAIGGII